MSQQPLARLRKLVAEGPLRARDLRERDPRLYSDLTEQFGSIPAARKAARLQQLPVERRWTVASISAELRRLHSQRVRLSLTNLMQLGRHDLIAAIRRHIGSLVTARRLAKLPELPRLETRPPTPWDEERVVDEILERAVRGEPLAHSKVFAVFPSLVSAAIRYCDSWRAAIELAGLDYEEILLVRPRWSKDELRDALHDLAGQHPDWSYTDLRTHPVGVAAIRLLGAIPAAVDAAGLTDWPRHRGSERYPTRAEVVRLLRRRERAGAAMNMAAAYKDDRRLIGAVLLRFGRWDEGLQAAGIERTPNKRPPLAAKNVIADLRKRSALGLALTPAAIKRDAPELEAAMRRRFGTAKKALEAARLQPRAAVAKRREPEPASDARWSPSLVVDELRRVHRLGVHITSTGLIAAGHHALLTATYAHIGSLVDARRIAGIAPPPAPRNPRGDRWTSERVTTEIRRRHRRKQPLAMSKVPGALLAAAKRHCGSWPAAIAAAGLDYDELRLLRGAWGKDELLAELRKLARANPNMPRSALYNDRRLQARMASLFGGIEPALVAAGLTGWARPDRKRTGTRHQGSAKPH